MRTTDERVDEVLGRARAHEAHARRMRQQAVAFGGGALSVVAVVAVGIGVSSAAPLDVSGIDGPFGLMGSVFAGGSALGYIAVGLLGLALGVAATVAAYRMGRKPDSPEMPASLSSDRPQEARRNASAESAAGNFSLSPSDDGVFTGQDAPHDGGRHDA